MRSPETPPGEPGSPASAALLVARYELAPEAKVQLSRLLELLVGDPLAPTAIKVTQAVLDDHLADSLIALELEALRAARAVLDLGSGAGLPGLPLAIAVPQASFTLLESSGRKCRFLERAVDTCQLVNVEIVHGRAETFEAGRGCYDVVTARAVSSLPVDAEYAAPLLRAGGSLVVWHGRRDPVEDAALDGAADELGLGRPQVRPVKPYPGVENRHLYVLSKLRDTPQRFPRRPGMAVKRPLGAQIARNQAPSDRIQR